MHTGFTQVFDSYIAGDSWASCQRCSERIRRSTMVQEWSKAWVCRPCLDPLPPQNVAPRIQPEGVPFPNAQIPQDDMYGLQDSTYLYPVVGGIANTLGQVVTNMPIGALSPQDILYSPQPPPSPHVLQDQREIRTGPVFPPQINL